MSRAGWVRVEDSGLQFYYVPVYPVLTCASICSIFVPERVELSTSAAFAGCRVWCLDLCVEMAAIVMFLRPVG